MCCQLTKQFNCIIRMGRNSGSICGTLWFQFYSLGDRQSLLDSKPHPNGTIGRLIISLTSSIVHSTGWTSNLFGIDFTSICVWAIWVRILIFGIRFRVMQHSVSKGYLEYIIENRIQNHYLSFRRWIPRYDQKHTYCEYYTTNNVCNKIRYTWFYILS